MLAPVPVGTHLHTLQLSVAGAVAQVAVAATYLLAARSGAPAEYGAVVAVTAAATAFGGLLDWGSGTNALRRVAAGSMSESTFHAWWNGRTVILSAMALAFAAFVLVGDHVAVLVAVGAAGMLALPPTVFAASIPYRIRGRFAFVSVTASLSRLSGLTLMGVAAAFSDRPYLLLPLALSVSLVIECALYRWFDRSARDPGTGFLWNVWKGTGWVGLSSSILSMQSLDVAVVSRSSTPAAAGEYAAVNRWTAPLGMPAAAFTQAVAPSLAGATSSRQALRALAPGLKWLWLVSAGAVLVVLFAGPLTRVLLGESYSSSADTLRLLAVGTVVAVVNQPLFAFLLARHRDVSATVAAAIVVFVQLGLTAVLSPALGAVGAGAAFLLGQVAGLTALIGLAWRCLRGENRAS